MILRFNSESPAATTDCASEVMSHSCHPTSGRACNVVRVTSVVEHEPATEVHVASSEIAEGHATIAAVKEPLPMMSSLYTRRIAEVGVIASGNL